MNDGGRLSESVAGTARAVREGVPGERYRYVRASLEAARRDRDRPDGSGAFLAVAPPDAAGPSPTAAEEGPEELGTLAGVPVGVKDNLATLGLPTTCASRMLEGYVSPYEATAVRRLREAGAVVVGKTNLDEFAMGSSTEHSAFGATLNPHDPTRVPGGSSGGSAAAVAAGVVPAALGSDTGGSVRQPGAFCGVVGLRPTYGRVSRYGLVAFASSLDQVGVLASDVEGAALLLQAVAGPDPRDATCSERPVPDLDEAARVGAAGAEGLVVGVPAEYYSAQLQPGVRRLLDRARRRLRDAGARPREISLPNTRHALAAYYVLAPAEASSNLARYDGVRYGLRADAVGTTDELNRRSRTEGFGPEVRRRILLGTFVLSAGHRDRHYRKASAVRRRVAQELVGAFEAGVDVLLTPTTPETAFRLGDRTDDPVAMYRSDSLTVPPSLAGVPAVSVPVGRVDGLPAGAQVVAAPWKESVLLRAASALEALVDGEAEA